MAYRFTPKKPIRSFRDLEVYQKTLECSVFISADVAPIAGKLGFKHVEGLVQCALSVPLLLAEAHSLRFADFALALGYLEKAMSGCNKAVVYLDQIKGLYGAKANPDLLEDIASRYIVVRLKMFRLEKSWRKFMDKTGEDRDGERVIS
jgi:hypothetical protein